MSRNGSAGFEGLFWNDEYGLLELKLRGLAISAQSVGRDTIEAFEDIRSERCHLILQDTTVHSGRVWGVDRTSFCRI